MSDTRKSTPLVELTTLILSPILIMMMVGSLVMFLIEVIYRGQYSARLVSTFFFFTIGAVLIARITIEQGCVKAGIYAAGLGGACFLAMMAFVEYPDGAMKAIGPVVNLLLMILVWFAADRLTWDCTHFDEARKASGRGVLAAAGLDDVKHKDEDDDIALDEKKMKKLGWWERLEAYRAERRKRPHTPGTRVLYFGLAALPLFALGQSVIPADDAARRSTSFFLMAAYIGSTLALLVTTSLMGLSRYLEERGAKVSPALTLGWLGVGGGMIVVFLFVGALLPRPHSETPLVELGSSKKGDKKASKNAVFKDGDSGKGEGAAGRKTTKGAGKADGKNGEAGGKSGEKNSGGGQGKSDGGKSSGDKSGGKQGDAKGNNADKSNGKNQQAKGDGKSGEAKDKNGEPETKDDQKNDGGGGEGEGEQETDDGSADKGGEESSAPSKLSEALQSISGFVKWVVWIVVAVAVIVGIVYFIVKWLSPFTNWAKSLLEWWRGLWQRKAKEGRAGTGSVKDNAVVERPPPFADFDNPFARGRELDEPGEVVRYTVAALESWAYDRDLGRAGHETPTEFVVRLGRNFAELDDPAFDTIQLYVRVLYGKRPIGEEELTACELLWEQLERMPMQSGRSMQIAE